jgi:hypothetical protein
LNARALVKPCMIIILTTTPPRLTLRRERLK